MANEDRAYTAWIRKQPCVACSAGPPSEAHHMCGAGMGLRAHDHTVVPLCSGCHKDHHEFRGHFYGMDRHERKKWQESRMKDLRKEYLGDKEVQT